MKITSRLIVLLGFCMAILLILAWPGESQAGPAVPENPPASEKSTDWTQAKNIFSEKSPPGPTVKIYCSSAPPTGKGPLPSLPHHWGGKRTLDTTRALDNVWRGRSDLCIRYLP